MSQPFTDTSTCFKKSIADLEGSLHPWHICQAEYVPQQTTEKAIHIIRVIYYRHKTR